MDLNRDRNKQKQCSKQRLKQLEMATKGSVLEAYTQTKRTSVCVACVLDDSAAVFCNRLK